MPGTCDEVVSMRIRKPVINNSDTSPLAVTLILSFLIITQEELICSFSIYSKFVMIWLN